MSPQGELIDAGDRALRATSLGTDRLLQQACMDGFFDRNPPPGAETADGNIHFSSAPRPVARIAGPNQMQLRLSRRLPGRAPLTSPVARLRIDWRVSSAPIGLCGLQETYKKPESQCFAAEKWRGR